MERYKLIISEEAKSNMRSVARYITNELHEPATAKKMLFRIRQEIASLKTMPERYALSTNSRYAKKGYRVTSAGKYLIFYRVDKPSKTVEVLNVLHGSRNMSQWL